MTKNILINEIFPAPSSGDPEWIELYNASTKAVNLDGYKLYDQISSQSLLVEINQDTFPNNLVLSPQGLLVVSLPTNKLNNSGDGIVLKNANQEILDTLSYSDSQTNLSWSRPTPTSEDQQIFLTSPTPNAPNPPLPSPSPSPPSSPSPTSSIQPSPSPSLTPTPTPSPLPSPFPSPTSTSAISSPESPTPLSPTPNPPLPPSLTLPTNFWGNTHLGDNKNNHFTALKDTTSESSLQPLYNSRDATTLIKQYSFSPFLVWSVILSGFILFLINTIQLHKKLRKPIQKNTQNK